MFGKIALAFLAAMIVALLCHRAVAQSLSQLPSLNLKTEAPLSPNCDMTSAGARALKAHILADASTANAYLNSVAVVYNGWYAQRAPKENQTADFAIGTFSPINQGAQTLTDANGVLDSAGDAYLNSVDVIERIISDCFLGDTAEQNVQSELAKFRHDLGDNQSAIDSFIGQMQSNLANDGGAWQPWEGQPTLIPVGTFATLQSDAGSFGQAASFIQQDGQMIANELDPIVAQVDSLTRK